METARVVKRGETCISVGLHRNAGGLSVEVRALPVVEDFMRQVGGGEVVHVASSGRYWMPPNGHPPLQAYIISALEPLSTDDGTPISLDNLGAPLLFDQKQNGKDILNLSFLRLVGISEGTGVTFQMKGVYSLTAMQRLKERIASATRKLYIEYIRPMDMDVIVSTSEISL